MKHTKKEKLRLFLIPTITITLLILLISSIYKDWGTIFKNNRETKELSMKYDKLLSEEEKLKSEVTKLKDPRYVARYAKEKFFYSADGEMIIRVDQ